MLSPAAQRADLRIVRTVLEESHVGLHWSLARATYLKLLAALDQRAARPIPARDFRLGLTRLVAALGHGHTTLETSSSGRGWRLRQLPTDSETLPLGMRVVGGRLFVAHDLTAGGDVGAGSELLAVDGQPAAALLTAMEALVSADGHVASFKHYQIGQGWRFQDLLSLLHGPSARYRVRVRSRAGRERSLVVEGTTSDVLMTRFAERRGRSLDAYAPAVAYAERGRDGVLTVGSLYEGLLAKDSPGFAAEFERAFAQISTERPERLILDVRGNEGGNNDLVPLLYSYLADRPFFFPGVTILKSDRMSGISYAQAPGDDLKSFSSDPRKFVVPHPLYGWVLRSEVNPKTAYEPKAQAYRGPLVVLADGGSFSATGGLIDLIHRFHRRAGRAVTFVGEAPGVDTRTGWGSGGQSLALILPGSGLRLAVPLLGSPYHFASAQRPVRLPDQLIEPTADDLAEGRDGVLARV
jgi:hypothetical protein